ncbi:MAG TPA: succinate dehydrogenase assembly factor 2 [Rhizomicrobium sp.]|nr:succinate dehydrogenase assembly factor 2 [Rhizomicrobium sp.]
MIDIKKGGSSENRRKRLLFRAERRGFKEVDLIFGAYAQAQLAQLDEAALDQFEALLTAPDQDVYAWLRGAAPVPPEFDNPVFAGLKAVCQQQSPRWNS